MANTYRDIFEVARELLDMVSVAERYGVSVDRHGKALCPFHNDTHPSMSIKPKFFKCFACGAGGDAVRFVSLLFGLTPIDALRKLNADFALGLRIDGKLSVSERKAVGEAAKRRAAEKALNESFKAWEKSAFIRLSDHVKELEACISSFRPKTPEDLGRTPPGYADATADLERCKAMLDILTFGKEEEEAELLEETVQIRN